MTETFDAVLAEMRELADRTADYGLQGLTGKARLDSFADRLAAAHAAEVGERDARIAELEAENRAVRSVMNTYNLGGWTDAIAPMMRAEAAERDARRAVGLLREVRGYLSAAEESSMSRNNSEQLAYEFGERIDALLSEQAGERENGDG